MGFDSQIQWDLSIFIEICQGIQSQHWSGEKASEELGSQLLTQSGMALKLHDRKLVPWSGSSCILSSLSHTASEPSTSGWSTRTDSKPFVGPLKVHWIPCFESYSCLRCLDVKQKVSRPWHKGLISCKYSACSTSRLSSRVHYCCKRRLWEIGIRNHISSYIPLLLYPIITMSHYMHITSNKIVCLMSVNHGSTREALALRRRMCWVNLRSSSCRGRIALGRLNSVRRNGGPQREKFFYHLIRYKTVWSNTIYIYNIYIHIHMCIYIYI